MTTQIVILAAGKGTRMHSRVPKVLHQLAGKPLLEHVMQTALQLVPDVTPIVIYGYQGEMLHAALSAYPIQWVMQDEQLGTGHAVLQALPHIAVDASVLILYGDVPLITLATLQKLMTMTSPQSLSLLTAKLNHPRGYGRIKRDSQQKIIGIVEEKDATETERAITEINPGIYVAPAPLLKKWLPQLQNKNQQKEYYLTDIISCAVQERIAIHSTQPQCNEEIFGVNDCAQLAVLERFYQRQCAEKLLQQGVTLADPARIDIRGEVDIGRDVYIDVNVIFEGRVKIGDHCSIGPQSILRDTTLGQGVAIKAYSYLDGVEVADDCILGPFARIRPGTKLAEQVHVGNFVEIKNSHIATGSKVNHLSYIGDATLGKDVNVGAGTITCNYDGLHKHQTIIEDDVHIGSDTQLVAPVRIGHGATIGAGSTITKDVAPEQLILTHTLSQREIKNWHRPKKKEGVKE